MTALRCECCLSVILRLRLRMTVVVVRTGFIPPFAMRLRRMGHPDIWDGSRRRVAEENLDQQ